MHQLIKALPRSARRPISMRSVSGGPTLVRMRKNLRLQVMTSPPSAAAKSFWNLGGLTPTQLRRTVFEHSHSASVGEYTDSGLAAGTDLRMAEAGKTHRINLRLAISKTEKSLSEALPHAFLVENRRR